jgi:hypothetical protein
MSFFTEREEPRSLAPSVNAQSQADLVSRARGADERPVSQIVSERQHPVRPKDAVAKTTGHYVFPNAF